MNSELGGSGERSDAPGTDAEPIPPDVLDALREVRRRFGSSLNTTVGLVVVAIGWILTSDSAQQTFTANGGARWFTVAAGLLIGALHQGALWSLWRMSRNLLESVDLGTRRTRSIVAPFHVDTGWAVATSVISGCLFATFALLVGRA